MKQFDNNRGGNQGHGGYGQSHGGGGGGSGGGGRENLPWAKFNALCEAEDKRKEKKKQKQMAHTLKKVISKKMKKSSGKKKKKKKKHDSDSNTSDSDSDDSSSESESDKAPSWTKRLFKKLNLGNSGNSGNTGQTQNGVSSQAPAPGGTKTSAGNSPGSFNTMLASLTGTVKDLKSTVDTMVTGNSGGKSSKVAKKKDKLPMAVAKTLGTTLGYKKSVITGEHTPDELGRILKPFVQTAALRALMGKKNLPFTGSAQAKIAALFEQELQELNDDV